MIKKFVKMNKIVDKERLKKRTRYYKLSWCNQGCTEFYTNVENSYNLRRIRGVQNFTPALKIHTIWGASGVYRILHRCWKFIQPEVQQKGVWIFNTGVNFVHPWLHQDNEFISKITLFYFIPSVNGSAGVGYYLHPGN